MFTGQLKKCGNPSVPENGVYGGGGYRKNRLNLMVLMHCWANSQLPIRTLNSP